MIPGGLILVSVEDVPTFCEGFYRNCLFIHVEYEGRTTASIKYFFMFFKLFPVNLFVYDLKTDFYYLD